MLLHSGQSWVAQKPLCLQTDSRVNIFKFYFCWWVSQKQVAFSAAIWVFFSQAATLMAHPFRPPQPGFLFSGFSLIGVVYLAKKKKSPFYPSGSNLEIRFKLLVAVLSLPGEGCEGGCQTSRAAVREGHPLPEIQMWAARSWPNYCCSLHPADTQHFPSPGRPSSTTSKEQTKPRR